MEKQPSKKKNNNNNNNNNSRCSTSGGSNMFKDAERMSSTFHKSKKIVRPGENSILPQGASQSTTGAVSTQNSATTATPPPPSSTTSSVSDRISGYNKDSSSPAAGAAARTQSSSSSTSHTESPTVGSSKVNRLPSKTSTTPPRPNSTLSSSPNVGNPFAVQLRKTNLPPLGATSNNIIR